MKPRYQWKIKDEYGNSAIYDNFKAEFVWVYPGDVLNMLNEMHELKADLKRTKEAFRIEQESSMELARKLVSQAQ